MIAKVTQRTELGPLRALPMVRQARIERGMRLRPTRSCAWIAVVEAHHAAIRSSSHSSMKAENWFQLRIVGVTKKSRDSDSGRSPLVRCGKYVSRACTLDPAPVQVRDTFSVLLNRASLEVYFGRHQGRLRFVAATMLSSAIRRILRHLGLRSIA
jgi:hypothetical protein